MAIILNTDAFEHARYLIDAGKIAEESSDWSDFAPTTAEENNFFAETDTYQYGRWFLGIDLSEDKESKARYVYPYGDFLTVYRGGLAAIKHLAAQMDLLDIEDAADELIDTIDSKLAPQHHV